MLNQTTYRISLRQRMVSYQDGFSLIELMVAMVIGLILTGGVVYMFLSANTSYRDLNDMSAQLESGRYAIQLIREDAQHAGFLGEMTDLGGLSNAGAVNHCNLPITMSSAAADVDGQTNMGRVIQGFNGAGVAPLGCLANYRPNTDVLVVRRASTRITPMADLTVGAFYLQSSYPSNYVLDEGGEATFVLARAGVTLDNLRQYLVHIYYIRSCNVCLPASDNIPTLVRRELRGNLGGNSWVDIPIAEGIENMVLFFGEDADGDGVADGAALTRANTIGDWRNVVTVEINMLARTPRPKSGYQDDKVYNLGGAGFVLDASTLTAQEREFRRQVFTTTVRVENIASRRED